MNNPVMNLLGNDTGMNTDGLLKMAMSIRTPRINPKQRRDNRSLLRAVTGSRIADLPKEDINPPGLIGGAGTGDSGIPGTTAVNLANKYGVNDKLWNTVSPLIDTYGLSVIEGYRDPATASSKSAKNSQHYTGNALDLNYSSLSPQRRRDLLKKVRGLGLSTGVGRNTLHVDTRPNKYWFYDDSGNWSTDTRYMPEWSQGIFR